MSVPADTLKYSEIQDAMEVLDSPESILISGFLEANEEHINDPVSSPPGKAGWEGYGSPSMTPEELWETAREEIERDEFKNALGYLAETDASGHGRLFETEDEKITLPRTKLINELGSLLIAGSKEGNREVVETVRRYEDEEGGLTRDQIDERVDKHYSFVDIRDPLGFLNNNNLQTETGSVNFYTSNLGNKFEAELYRQLGKKGMINVEMGRPGCYNLEIDQSSSRSYLQSAREGLQRLGFTE